MIWLKSTPDDSGGIFKRIVRVTIILCLFYTANSIWDQVVEILLFNESIFATYTLRVLLDGFLVWSSTEINIKMGLMQESGMKNPI